MSCGPGRRRRIQEAAVGFEILGFELAYLSSIGLPSTRIIAIKGGRYEGLGRYAAMLHRPVTVWQPAPPCCKSPFVGSTA